MEGNLADVRCESCGAPARFDILSQSYLCSYCGGSVGISEALAQKQGFRDIRQEHLKRSAAQARLLRANCTGCGASIVFEEGEPVTDCAFCGRALVRSDYLSSGELPELIIPFRITREEAAGCLEEWRSANRGKAEARHLKNAAAELQGFYLPYELVRGPVYSTVGRMDCSREFNCRGYIDDIFVNCSKQINNQLLEGFEPFELGDLREFELSYVAGHRVKLPDTDTDELVKRVETEVSENYAPVVRKTLRSKAVTVKTTAGDALRMPVLLPVYYVSNGWTAAAVNGQTGKVSVLAEKFSRYFFIPWWIKAILSTAALSAVCYGFFSLFRLEPEARLFLTAVLGFFFFIVSLVAFSDTVRNKLFVPSGRKVFTSKGGPLHRQDGRLVRDRQELKKETVPPAFFETLGGKTEHVKLVFASPRRRLRMVILAMIVLFLPVITALFVNGFDFAGIHLSGSAVWFCIAVPVVPVYLLKAGVIDFYEHPWIYIIKEDGKKKRYRKKEARRFDRSTVRAILLAVFVPPASLAVWFGIISFIVMVYITAFG